jgi:pimeloyl-ACP methyl ester carboxylesterase
VAVIHGSADPLVRPVAAKQLGYLMPHARVELMEGMGHDLPEPLLGRFAEISFETIGRAG